MLVEIKLETGSDRKILNSVMLVLDLYVHSLERKGNDRKSV